MRNTFRAFDTEGNGLISLEELQEAMVQHGVAQVSVCLRVRGLRFMGLRVWRGVAQVDFHSRTLGVGFLEWRRAGAISISPISPNPMNPKPLLPLIGESKLARAAIVDCRILLSPIVD